MSLEAVYFYEDDRSLVSRVPDYEDLHLVWLLALSSALNASGLQAGGR